MSLRRQLGVTLLVQGAGSASLLLATIWLGASLGPEPQGVFSRTKAEIEFVAAFAMFGLPQALFYFVKSAQLGDGAALRWVIGSSVLALPIAAAYAWAQHGAGAVLPLAGLALAAAVCVFHGQLRALLLVRERIEWFNLVTALPQMLLLVGVLVMVGLGVAQASLWPWLFALAFGVAAGLALRRFLGAAHEPALAHQTGWRELGHYGLAAWLAAALSTAAIVLVQRWVEHTQGAAMLGLFTMALTLLQVPLTPVAYAAPLLLRRWMEQPGARAARRVAALLFGLLLVAALLLWLSAPLWPGLGLGEAYSGLARALAVLLVGGAADAASRVLGVNANASGVPWVAVRAELARWVVLGIGWVMLTAPDLMSLCALWAAAALAAAAVFVGHAWGGTAAADGFA